MLKRSAIVVHRWLGVAVCLLFLIWFPSGIAMIYWEYPSVTATDRLDRAPALEPSTIRVSPANAFLVLDQSHSLAGVTLNTIDGRPVYRFRTGRSDSLVYADTGVRWEVTTGSVARAAAAWTGQPIASATVQTLDQADQWTLPGSFRPLRPLQKYSWPDGSQVYVSLRSGEVEQSTTTASRVGAYLGPIPHWFYFTPLRSRASLWNRVVVWSSGIGTVTAILGLVIGVSMYSPAKRYRVGATPTSIPYRGQKRWHMAVGLIFGVAAVTWAFSGMLSMDPIPSLTRQPRSDVGDALRGRLQLTAFSGRGPADVLGQLRGFHVKELELASIGGEPVYIATLDRGAARIVRVNGSPQEQFDPQSIAAIVAAASTPDALADARMIGQYDAYYRDRHRRLPLPVILATVNDSEHTRYYIDPTTARLVGSYSSGAWTTRWLYHGLHSLDFPWLYDHRPLWDIVMIGFMLGGTALSVTSLILAWRVIGAYFFGGGVQRAALSAGPLSR